MIANSWEHFKTWGMIGQGFYIEWPVPSKVWSSRLRHRERFVTTSVHWTRWHQQKIAQNHGFQYTNGLIWSFFGYRPMTLDTSMLVVTSKTKSWSEVLKRGTIPNRWWASLSNTSGKTVKSLSNSKIQRFDECQKYSPCVVSNQSKQNVIHTCNSDDMLIDAS